MASYGDDATIIQMLGPGASSFSAGFQTRVTELNAVVSALVEEKTGRTWSVTSPTATTRIVYQRGGTSSVLVLPEPAVSISAITIDQDDEGGVLSGGSALDADQWSVVARNGLNEITMIQTNNRLPWFGYSVVSITAVWASTVQTVPPDIEWVVNYVVAERMKQEQANPAGFVGPDGTVAPVRDPWSDRQVKDILRRHRLTGKTVIV